MDVKYFQKLAGINQLREGQETVEFRKPTVGQNGTILVVEGKSAKWLAKILGVKADWKLKPINNGFVAYDGSRLTFFDNQSDFDPE